LRHHDLLLGRRVSPENWITLVLGLLTAIVLPLLGYVVRLQSRLQRVEQLLAGNGARGVVDQVESLRKDSHWVASCLTVLALSPSPHIELPERPQ
jgi:hypothetical protein